DDQQPLPAHYDTSLDGARRGFCRGVQLCDRYVLRREPTSGLTIGSSTSSATSLEHRDTMTSMKTLRCRLERAVPPIVPFTSWDIRPAASSFPLAVFRTIRSL